MALKKSDIGNLGLKSKKTPPAKFAKEGATEKSDYADPERFKYPVHKAENVKAAISYFGDESNREGYAEADQKRIAKRILRAARRFNIVVDPGSAVGRLAGLKRQ